MLHTGSSSKKQDLLTGQLCLRVMYYVNFLITTSCSSFHKVCAKKQFDKSGLYDITEGTSASL